MWITQDKQNRVVIPWLILPLISCLIFFCCRSVTYFSWLKSKQKVPTLAKTVILRFAHKSQATFLGHAKFASNNFSFKHRGQKNSLFTHKQQHVMHRSNSICPISAVWTVVCCVFDSAGVFWNYLCCSLYNKDYTNIVGSDMIGVLFRLWLSLVSVCFYLLTALRELLLIANKRSTDLFLSDVC